MKKRAFVLFLFLLMAVLQADPQAGSAQPILPNLYQLAGGQLHISYSSTGKNGQPHFTYQDGSQTLSFSGSQIRRTKTEIGTLLSVTIRMTVDAGSTSFTLLLPDVKLEGELSPAQIHTLGITTVHKFSVAPAMNRGQIQTYTTTELSGTASLVYF